ncbi:tyrosine-type recombinase/integrase [Amycolatopsis sp. H20-H5]|uniref:tyrosine-type recombinase/integrase n=1 Tax=Amycolatopsis sp. H20-H5 TaxID=3046309 RepID=UPI002DBF3DEE|nr:site-specific integrase [Amycolatopsis sp. H20-H5]MEC3974605.1 site-specific integrase [Amycolatopsis sp. H20-H5]
MFWDESRQRWTAEATVGYSAAGKRIVRRGRGKTKTEAQKKLREIIRDLEDGTPAEAKNFTVEHAIRDWLKYGLPGRSQRTIDKLTTLAEKHVIPSLGARKLPALTADEGDKWLAEKAEILATRTLREVRSIPIRAIARAQAREKVKRNVMVLCELPQGQEGRPSKALTFEQAEAVLAASERTQLWAYVVLSLLLGARTEELRPLAWSHVDLVGSPDADPPIPPHIMVWRSVREGGDTKTRKSRRSLALPQRCVEALRVQKVKQEFARRVAGNRWQENGLVFASNLGTELDARNVRRAFRKICQAAGLEPAEWTPRELRHSFASLLSDNGMPIEQISRLMGHNGTAVTELVYRHQIRPVVEHGAEAMDRIFKSTEGDSAA